MVVTRLGDFLAAVVPVLLLLLLLLVVMENRRPATRSRRFEKPVLELLATVGTEGVALWIPSIVEWTADWNKFVNRPAKIFGLLEDDVDVVAVVVCLELCDVVVVVVVAAVGGAWPIMT